INMRNQGAMLSDPGVREVYVQGAVARGMEAAGSNRNGSMAGFMGMGVGMNAGGGFMGAASQANLQQMQMNQMAGNPQMAGNQQMTGAPQMAGNQQMTGTPQTAAAQTGTSWTCQCGAVNTGKFCPECGTPRPAGPWTCECGTVNSGKFCSECGKPRP
ncbi:MAG: virion core protein, partial [Clostridiaceae bacterium]|nr:virion core protein [Clostridiaceae bacterium]